MQALKSSKKRYFSKSSTATIQDKDKDRNNKRSKKKNRSKSHIQKTSNRKAKKTLSALNLKSGNEKHLKLVEITRNHIKTSEGQSSSMKIFYLETLFFCQRV